MVQVPESAASAATTRAEPELPRLTLLNIGRGAAIELFDQELKKALANILDPNTEAEAKRTITLKVTITPTSKERSEIAVGVEADSKLAPFKGAGSLAFVGMRRGEAIAVTHDPKQMQLDWDDESRPRPLHPTAP